MDVNAIKAMDANAIKAMDVNATNAMDANANDWNNYQCDRAMIFIYYKYHNNKYLWIIKVPI